MKTLLRSVPVAVLLLVLAGPAWALMSIALVSLERADELGLEVRAEAAGPDAVRVQLAFPLVGPLKDFTRVELRMESGERSLMTAALREDHSKPGRVSVGFTSARDQLDRLTLWVVVRIRSGPG